MQFQRSLETRLQSLGTEVAQLQGALSQLSPYWEQEGHAIRYEGPAGAGCGYNQAIDYGYSFAFREPTSGRAATVLVEAAAGADAALTEDLARLALGRYLPAHTLPTRIVLRTDGSFRRA